MTDPIDLATCTEAELWRHVASHLERRGIGVTLVGGAVVSVYSQGAYRSGDLDFVTRDLFTERVTACMAELGFGVRGRHFEHPECPHLFIEFVPGPLGIGDDLDITPREEVANGMVIRILSPTDCVRDRLASFIHFHARECLDQAVLVAKAQPIDHTRVKRWCHEQGARGRDAYAAFSRRIQATGDS